MFQCVEAATDGYTCVHKNQSSILTTLPLMFVEMLRTGRFFITGSGKDGRGSLGDPESFEIYLIKHVPLGH